MKYFITDYYFIQTIRSSKVVACISCSLDYHPSPASWVEDLNTYLVLQSIFLLSYSTINFGSFHFSFYHKTSRARVGLVMSESYSLMVLFEQIGKCNVRSIMVMDQLMNLLGDLAGL